MHPSPSEYRLLAHTNEFVEDGREAEKPNPGQADFPAGG